MCNPTFYNSIHKTNQPNQPNEMKRYITDVHVRRNSTYTLVKVCVFYECVCVCCLLVYSSLLLLLLEGYGWGELSEGRQKYTSVIPDVIQFPI